MLGVKLDEYARNVFAGYEDNYTEAMKRLESFYGNPYKVVSCISSEVDASPEICEGDYQGLISYCTILERNYNRLKSMEPPLEHEMSNSTTMSKVLSKFPISSAVKWAEFIETQENDVKAKPFPTFISWLISQKSVWERVAAVESSELGGSLAQSHYARGGGGPPSAPKCYLCGKEGHKERSCPQKKPDPKKKKPRKRPEVKKFWCAFHKEDPNKHCSSVNCADLRKADPATRLQLLKENHDCSHCCGDHAPANCMFKQRVCG